MSLFPVGKLVFDDGFIKGIRLNAGGKVVLVFHMDRKLPKVKIVPVVYCNRTFIM